MSDWFNNLTDPLTIQPVNKIESPNAFPKPLLKSNKQLNSNNIPQQQQPHFQIDQLKLSKAWDIALAPGKQLPMTLFMSYMSGSSLQLIPLSMTFMLFVNSINSIININSQFNGLITDKNKDNIILTKFIYIILQILTLTVGIWKLNTMGLIPNQRGDWLAWESSTKYIEKLIII
ncbi:hypothetical protein WICMUC_002416 [Wickerhamomyces mucosus]|uniref:ER membrane protein complex subunit 4 n=1 Tax=Wickerhamomyces mucosus TaxID=1378264 RepID=A0A9P8PRF0_9ASCO|nr:hypothetical protein WICMUC_002416 [Wickerhamomyces mucosus]